MYRLPCKLLEKAYLSLAAYPKERKNAEVPHGNAVNFNSLVGTFTQFLVYRKVHTQGRSVINVITDNELDTGVLAFKPE
jgi:hypothetical protein